MALYAGAYQIIEPSYQEPEFFVQINQASGYAHVLAGAEPRVRLSDGDLAVFAKKLEVRTRVATTTGSTNELPSVDITASYFSANAYLTAVRNTYNHHDIAAASRWGFALTDAYVRGMRQAHFQNARDAALFGLQPQLGEGLLNAAGAYTANLPADQFGNTSSQTYDNGQLAQFILTQISQIKVRTMQAGQKDLTFTVLGPQRVMQPMQTNIVQLTASQRPGGGSNTVYTMIKDAVEAMGDKLVWAYDDSLQGAGATANTDVILISMPEIAPREPIGNIDTDAFASLQPNNLTCVTQYMDLAAPREIISPMAGGFVDHMMELRVTSGWAQRPEALTILSIPYV
jgi:hypothetical protein